MSINKNVLTFPSLNIFYAIALIIFGLSLPLLLIPLVALLGNSEVIEEIFKAAIIFFVVLKIFGKSWQLLGAVSFAVLFGVSENFLYLNQIFQTGDVSIFFQRFIWTVPMHVITALCMYYFGFISKKLFIVGVVLAILIHLFFNAVIAGMVVSNI